MLPNLELYKKEIRFNPFRLNMLQISFQETSYKSRIFGCGYIPLPSIEENYEKGEEKEEEEEKSIKEDFSCSLNFPLFSGNHENILSLEESEDNINRINQNNNGDSKTKEVKKKIFKVMYRMVEDASFEQNKNSFLSKKKARNHNYKNRYKCKDVILNKIGRHFFNDYLFNKINDMIKDEGYHFYFIRFPREFVLNAVKKTNKKIWKMTLKNIFAKKKLYSTNDIESHYNPNLNVILKLEENKNNMEKTGLKNILRMKLCDLYKDYLNSDYKKKQIDDIKKTFDDSYVERYINFSTTFLENFI